MLITHYRDKNRHKSRAIRDLVTLLEWQEQRPCFGCQLSCSCSQSVTCICDCTMTCQNAPAMHSSDPSGYPIETSVMPLVLALSSLGVVQPCWSCEGHLDGLGRLHKIPQVWFYSDSALYPNIIAYYLSDLFTQKKTTYNWEVALCAHGYKNEITFTIKPNLIHESNKSLNLLQKDIRQIAENLVQEVRSRSRKRLHDLQNAVG